MLRLRVAALALLLPVLCMFGAPAAGAAVSAHLLYNPVWGPNSVTITVTYHADLGPTLCPPAATTPPGAPSDTPVWFRLDGSSPEEGGLDASCTASVTYTRSLAAVCSADHTFTAAMYSPGDDGSGPGVGQASISWPKDYPTMGPYGCQTPGPIPPPDTANPAEAAAAAAAAAARSATPVTSPRQRASVSPAPAGASATPAPAPADTSPGLTPDPAPASATSVRRPAGGDEATLAALPASASRRTTSGASDLAAWLAGLAALAVAGATSLIARRRRRV